jgi:hypothetical protein
MAYVGTPIDTTNQFQSLQGKRFSGDGSTTAFTLDIAPTSVFDIEVFVENVRQDPNSAYSLNGTTLTFTGAPASGTNNIYVIHQAKAVGTISPTSDSVVASSIADEAIESEHLNNNIISGQTALTLPPAATDEFLISDGGTIKRVDYSVIGNTPAFLVNLSGDQSLNSGAFTKITFDSEVYDTNSAFASNKFTVPANLAGKYVLTAGIYLDNIDDTEYLELFFFKNGSSANFGRQVVFAPNTNRHGAFTSTITLSLSASDYIEIYVYHDEGSAQSARSAYTFFAGHRLAGV